MDEKEKLDDYELCLLEHLTYMNADGTLKNTTADHQYIPLEKCETVELYLMQFDIEALREHPNENTNNDYISGAEYATIIDAMLRKEEIRNLRIQGHMDNIRENDNVPLAYDLVDSSSGKHYVIFKGTSGKFEWEDDVSGINLADTPSQSEAYDFVENINSNNITVIGHSKGGNKAMYCAVRSDKVERCVSMDGQGFSDEFLIKYRHQIEKKAGIIKSISYKLDPVHALMNPIPGSKLIFTGGNNGVNSAAECHSPNSIFSYDENGNIIEGLHECDESKSIRLIYGLTEYLMHSNCEDKDGMIQFLAEIAGQVATDGDFIKRVIAGEKKINAEEMEQFTTLVAYLISYCNENDVSSDELYTLLRDFQVVNEGDKWWPGIDPSTWLWIGFSYVKSNEQDQDYILLKFVDGLVYDVNEYAKTQDNFWTSSPVGYLLNQGLNLNENSKYIDTATKVAANVLLRIKRKYKSIDYDSSRKVLFKPIELKTITVLDDLEAKANPSVFYDLPEIQRALQKMEDAKILYAKSEMLPEISLSGKSVEACLKLCQNYDNFGKKIYELIEKTYRQVKSIYDSASLL